MDKVKQYLLPLSFLLVPFGFLSCGVLHTGHRYALVLAAILVMASLIKNRWVSLFMYYSVAWMVFIFVLKMVMPQIPTIVVKSAYDTVIYLLIGAIIFYAATQSNIKNEVFYNVICGAALLQATIAFGQVVGFDPVVLILSQALETQQQLSKNALTGTLFNNNFLAAYLAIALPFFFRPVWRGFIPLIVFCLFFANTTSAFIPALIGASFFFYHEINALGWRKAALVWTLDILLGVWYAFFYHPFVYIDQAASVAALASTGLYNPRIEYWLEALQQVFSHPVSVLLGMGPGAGWGKPYPLHNEWLTCLHNYGLVGLTLLGGYAATVYRGNRLLLASFIVIAVNMFGNYPLHLAPSAFLIALVAGLLERGKIQQGV